MPSFLYSVILFKLTFTNVLFFISPVQYLVELLEILIFSQYLGKSKKVQVF